MKLVNSKGKTIINFKAPLWNLLWDLLRIAVGIAVILALFYVSCEPI